MISDFLCEKFQFFVVKCSVYLNRHVFVMDTFSYFSTNAYVGSLIGITFLEQFDLGLNCSSWHI